MAFKCLNCGQLIPDDGDLSAHLILCPRRYQNPCPSCQDRPGKNGLGRPCKKCKGTGWIARKAGEPKEDAYS